jgi:hypothetical protein
MVIGSPKNNAPDEARTAASDVLARVRLGEDPAAERSAARKAETVRELFAAFMENHVRSKRKARTTKLFDGCVRNHIEPALGTRKACPHPPRCRAASQIDWNEHPVTATGSWR